MFIQKAKSSWPILAVTVGTTTKTFQVINFRLSTGWNCHNHLKQNDYDTRREKRRAGPALRAFGVGDVREDGA